MAPLRRLLGRGATRAGYQTTGKARAITIPLTLINAWPGEHSMLHSQHSKNDEESGELDQDAWASRMDPVTNKIGESELNNLVYAPQFNSVVVNGASANLRATGSSEDMPSNQIKVSKDLTWSEETVKERKV